MHLAVGVEEVANSAVGVATGAEDTFSGVVQDDATVALTIRAHAIDFGPEVTFESNSSSQDS